MAQFIDTPVKRYSSGMTVRLAFSVAAHLEPEILIVDEVLAVGDAAFQRKSLRKIAETSTHGRTVLFVSHNLVTVENLCTRTLILKGGQLLFDGTTQAALATYRQGLEEMSLTDLAARTDRTGTGRVRLTHCTFTDENARKLQAALTGQRLFVRLGFECSQPVRGVEIGFNLYQAEGQILLNFNSCDREVDFGELPRRGEFVCEVPRLPLRAGRYFGNLYCAASGTVADWVKNAITLDVDDRDFHGSGQLSQQGIVVTEYGWSIASSTELQLSRPSRA
jgi:lipopolysaccharide transport system ATP-binding protein